MSDHETRMEGGCHCGSIRFRVSGSPSWIGACYCIDCRKVSGSPYTVFACYDTQSIKLLRGAPKEYASSKNVRRSFCEKCSSPFAYRYVEAPEEETNIYIPVGVLDHPAELMPEQHIWVSQKLRWVHIHDDLPQRER